ncbi:MAG TPA: hypothetical protein VMP67_03470 [Candidatus Limnocylindria bacterium]|nr:hypothetical protein [Candidatus Limnocylindria bacterium]
MSTTPRRLALLLALGLVAACGAPAVSPSPSAAPHASLTPSPTSPPSPAPPSASPDTEAYVATIAVVGEQYRILLTDPADIEIARRLLAGEEAPSIPNGLIVRGDPGVNTGYSWHIDPQSVEFADMTMELCDGLPSFVEDGTLEGDRFCPWSAEIVDLQPAD